MRFVASPALDLGTCAFGRAIDSNGLPLDDGPELRGCRVALAYSSPNPNEREAITMPLWTGIRTLDGLLTIGRGARIGVFGPPGTGKSTLIEAIVEGCECDTVVVALVGERGREAQRWIEMRQERTTVICATSDRSFNERIAAARVAVAHAAALRRRGLHVLLVLDSLARVAMALREAGVAAGESVGRAGYPPSVFSELARLVEVAGAVTGGSITLVATVLSDGDDRDPVSEAARSLLDGHIALSLRLAESSRFPAIDVPASTSRTMDFVIADAHRHAASQIRRALALLDRIDDARALGLQTPDRMVLAAMAAEPRIENFLRQGHEISQPQRAIEEIIEIAAFLDQAHARR
jgi:FliI/YscN family ATPase